MLFLLRCSISTVAAVLVVLLPAASLALQAPSALEALDDREREVLEAIASRPAETRDAALLVTQYPDILVRIELIQARSSAAFELRVAQLDREHQEQLWELVRTPGAVEEIVKDGVRDAAELDAIAAGYPEPLRDVIRHLGDEHFETLHDAHAIKARADIDFAEEIAFLPSADREAFRKLVEDPELLAMLARSPSAVVDIGDAFRMDEVATRARLDAIALELVAANALVEEEWREGLENDPEAQTELEAASREYSEEYGYGYDELTAERVPVSVTVYHRYSPYPYWYGYPIWYAHWVPWGVWYPVYPHFGYYYGYGHRRVYYGLPSLHFVHWFYGGHHRRYNHVSRHFRHHGHKHHRSSHPVSRTVRRYDRHNGHGDRNAHAGSRGGPRHGSPETIRGSGSAFRGSDGRTARGTRGRSAMVRGDSQGQSRMSRGRGTRKPFRSRSLRMPDSSFGRHASGTRNLESGGRIQPDQRGAGRLRTRSRTERADRVRGSARADRSGTTTRTGNRDRAMQRRSDPLPTVDYGVPKRRDGARARSGGRSRSDKRAAGGRQVRSDKRVSGGRQARTGKRARASEPASLSGRAQAGGQRKSGGIQSSLRQTKAARASKSGKVDRKSGGIQGRLRELNAARASKSGKAARKGSGARVGSGKASSRSRALKGSGRSVSKQGSRSGGGRQASRGRGGSGGKRAGSSMRGSGGRNSGGSHGGGRGGGRRGGGSRGGRR